MKDFLRRVRIAAPLLICVGIIFPWAVSPFGLASCSSKTGSFIPESRSVLRQWLPLEVELDTSVDQKEEPSSLGGLNGVEIYYFDPLILVFLFVGFLTWGFCRSGGRAKVVFSRCLAGLIWAYLTALLILIFSISSSHSFWLQPGIVMVFLGYLTLSAGGIFDFFNWLKAKLKRSSVPRSKLSLG